MKKERKPESFIHKPEYPGGSKALSAFLNANLKYPKEALENQIEGVVRLRIDIDRNGKVIKAVVIQGLGYGCDEEAQRVVKLLKFNTKPPKSGHVIYHKDLNIPVKIQQNGMTYSVKPKVEKDKTKNTKSNTYTYTINY